MKRRLIIKKRLIMQRRLNPSKSPVKTESRTELYALAQVFGESSEEAGELVIELHK
jgi:hypothetical protein